MEIKTGTYRTIDDARDYFSLVKNLYQEKNGFSYFYNDLQKALHYTIGNVYQKAAYMAVYKENKLQGQIVLIEDDRLASGEAFFGFFECLQNPDALNILWAEFLKSLFIRGIGKFHGPVNGSIWHNYRLIKSSNSAYPAFNSEPLSQDWYYLFFYSLKPEEVIGYHSASRRKFNFIAQHTKESYENMLRKGFAMDEPTFLNPELVVSLHELSKQVFKDSWGYVELSGEEFLALYSQEKVREHIGKIYLIRKNEKLVGFCSTVKDSKKLIMKTIAIHPDFQQEGLGNALVHKVHSDALSRKVPEIIYALIRDTNKVQHFPKDDVVIFREYACFTFSTR